MRLTWWRLALSVPCVCETTFAYRKVDGTVQQFNPTSPPIERCALGIHTNLAIIFGFMTEEQAWKNQVTPSAKLFQESLEKIIPNVDEESLQRGRAFSDTLSAVLRGLALPQLQSRIMDVFGKKAAEGDNGDDKTAEGIFEEIISKLNDAIINPLSQRLSLPTATLTFLSSKAMNAFLGLMITSSGTVVPSLKEDGKIDVELFKLQSRMHNLAAQSCQTIDYAWKRDVDWVWAICNIMDLVETLLACGNIDFDRSTCVADATPLPDCPVEGIDTKVYAPLKFVDLLAGGNVIPDDLNDQATNLWADNGEGVASFFLYRGLQAFMKFASHDYFCGVDEPAMPYIPGWNTVLEIGAREEGERKISGSGRDRVPIWAVLRSEQDKCKTVVLARGTANTYEWRVDFTTILQESPMSPSYKAHQGFLSMLAAGSPILDSYIQSELFSEDCPCEQVEFVLSGHSLGGAMANLLGMHLVETYKKTCGAKVTVVAFASPHVFDDAARDLVRSNVNVRNIMATMDPIPYFPCHTGNSVTGFPRCPRNHLVTLSSNGEETDLFGEHVGRMEIDYLYFAKYDPAWVSDSLLVISANAREAKITRGIPAPLQIGAYHSCSYACYFSQFCSTNPEYMCNCDYLVPETVKPIPLSFKSLIFKP